MIKNSFITKVLQILIIPQTYEISHRIKYTKHIGSEDFYVGYD